MEPINAEEASAEAVHKAKNAAQAVEFARQAQQAELVESTAQKTKAALLEGLREVFNEGDTGDPEQMKIMWRKIPLLCTQVLAIHTDISEIKKAQDTVTGTQSDIKADLRWIKYIGGGFVSAAGLLALKSLGL